MPVGGLTLANAILPAVSVAVCLGQNLAGGSSAGTKSSRALGRVKIRQAHAQDFNLADSKFQQIAWPALRTLALEVVALERCHSFSMAHGRSCS